MKNQEHKYAQVLRWIADGEKVQQKIDGEWVSLIPNMVLSLVAGHNIQVEHFRIKPSTIRVNGVEVPAPERKSLEKSTGYFAPTFNYEGDPVIFYEWEGDKRDLAMLERGIVYLREEDAIARAKAMLLTQE